MTPRNNSFNGLTAVGSKIAVCIELIAKMLKSNKNTQLYKTLGHMHDNGNNYQKLKNEHCPFIKFTTGFLRAQMS